MSFGHRASILVVDDNQGNLVVYGAALEKLAARVVCARSGEEALQATATEDFAVVLMDVMMPGLDGFQTAALMRQHERSRYLPIIFVTAAQVEPRWLDRAYDLGAVDLLHKPINPEILLAKVRAFVAIHEREIVAREAQAAIAREHAARDAAEDANRQKDEFLSMISHELRTPLGAVIGWTELLRAGRLAGPDANRALDTILRAARTQARIVDDLLDIGRIAAGKVTLEQKPLLFGDLVLGTVEALRPLAAARGVSITAQVDRVPVLGDGVRLSQVVWNLISNAIKFSRAEGGVLSIRLAAGSESSTLTVADNGMGIAPEFLPRVFERFRQEDGSRTRRHGGLGLGLSIARHIVEAHGGTITAKSEGPGRGATFYVCLPLLAANAPTAVESELTSRATVEIPQISPLGTGRLQGVRVLVVEDDEDSRELLATVLEQEGASVGVASTVAAALERFERQAFDILVSDLGLPDEHGISLIRRVRKTSKIPAVAMTGYAGAEEQAMALEAGFDSWMPKPISAPKFVSVLIALASRAAAAGN